MGDSTIICNEVIKLYNEEIKTIPKNFNKKKLTCKTQNCYILLLLLLITIALLIAISIYLIKYEVKNLLSFNDTKLTQFCFDSIN